MSMTVTHTYRNHLRHKNMTSEERNLETPGYPGKIKTRHPPHTSMGVNNCALYLVSRTRESWD